MRRRRPSARAARPRGGRRGPALTDRLGLLAVPAVRSAVSREIGYATEYHHSIASTQDRALELAPRRALVVADEQTAGRGTRGRSWVAPAGTSLLASFVFPRDDGGRAPASLVAGVALARALESLGAREARLRWPNDVEIGARKVAGILTHASSGPPGALVIGIGINVRQRRDGFPPDLRTPATSLAAEGVAIDRLVLLERLARELSRAFDGSEHGLLDEWEARSSVMGRRVLVDRAAEPPVRGIAHSLGSDGALVVETPYGRERILVGEVRLEE